MDSDKHRDYPNIDLWDSRPRLSRAILHSRGRLCYISELTLPPFPGDRSHLPATLRLHVPHGRGRTAGRRRQRGGKGTLDETGKLLSAGGILQRPQGLHLDLADALAGD